MPSPVGHALGGIAAAWAAIPPGSRRRHAVGCAAAVAALGAAPDLDLLFLPVHRGPTHSFGAAALAGLAVFAIARDARWALAAAAAWASHIVLDWLGADTRLPSGVMALWPYSTGYFESTLHLFPAVSRRYWLPEFWIYNSRALAVELLVLLPIAWAVVAASRRRDRRA